MKKLISKILLKFKSIIESLVFFLIKKNYLNFAYLISKLFKYFFLREIFVRKQINYNNINELLSLIKKEKVLKLKNTSNFNLIGKKILFLGLNKYNFKSYWLGTAKNLRAKVHFYPTDNVSYIKESQNNFKVLNKFELNLNNKIKQIKPDLIFMDINYLGNKNTINQKILQNIKKSKSHKPKIVGWIGDIYSNAALEIVKYWSKYVDFIIYSEPLAKKYINKTSISNFKFINFCVNEKSFYFQKKKRLLFFSGTGSISRYPFLIAVIKKYFYNNKILILFHNKYNNLSISLSKYQKNIRQSQSTINFTCRNIPHLRVFVGRAFEAIASKSLLIEEKNNSIYKLLRPYRDFIPFDSVKELLIAIDFVKRYPKLTLQISNNAYNHYQNKYHSKFFWKKLFFLISLKKNNLNY